MDYVKPPFCFREPNTPKRWVRWEKQFGTYYVAAELDQKSKLAQEIHPLFTFDNNDEKKEYKTILGKFRSYCRPKKNVVYERNKFWSQRQNREYNMIRDKIVYGVFDKKVQEPILHKSDLALKDATDMCQAAEASQAQILEIRKQDHVAVSEVEAHAADSVVEGIGDCSVCRKPGHLDCPSCTTVGSELLCSTCRGFGHMSCVCPSVKKEM